MLIVSKQRDYYDYLTNVYGVDEKIVYNRELTPTNEYGIIERIKVNGHKKERFGKRTRKTENYESVFTEVYYTSRYTDRFVPRFYVESDDYLYGDRVDYELLVICGKVYPVFLFDDGVLQKDLIVHTYIPNRKLKMSVYNPELHSHLFKRIEDYEFGKEYRELIDIQRRIGMPVFVLKVVGTEKDGGKYISYCPPPLLTQWNVESVYPADQLYQDISYFIANVLNESPDVQPKGKPPQTNEEKIVASGFDLKTSFRGKVK